MGNNNVSISYIKARDFAVERNEDVDFFFFLMHQKVYIINRCINVWKSVINNCITVVVWSDPQPPAWDTAAISQHDHREFYLSFFQVDI